MSGELCITIQLFPSESHTLINLLYPPTSPSKLSEAVGFWLYFWHPHFESCPWNRLSCGGGYVIFLWLSRKISTSYTKLRQYWFFLNPPTLLFTIIHQFETVSSKLITPLNLLQTDRSLVSNTYELLQVKQQLS